MSEVRPATLPELLTLERLERDLFRGRSRHDGLPQLFGGQVVAQALLAASATVDSERPPNSLHAYFLRPGDASRPIVYEVERSRDGSRFASRNVQAIQDGEVILSLMASFHIIEEGFERHPEFPVVPAPETLTPAHELYEAWNNGPKDQPPGLLGLFALAQRVGIEIRPVPASVPNQPTQQLWLRYADCASAPPLMHLAVLAYASDFGLLGTAKLQHGGWFGQPDMVTASLDHALWFHRAARVDDWLLYCMDTPTAFGARGSARGLIYDRHGQLLASVAQEGLMRPRRVV